MTVQRVDKVGAHKNDRVAAGNDVKATKASTNERRQQRGRRPMTRLGQLSWKRCLSSRLTSGMTMAEVQISASLVWRWDDVKGGTRGEQVATSFHVFVQSFVVFFASTHIHTKYE